MSAPPQSVPTPARRPAPSSRLRVFVVDEPSGAPVALRALSHTEPDITLVGEAPDPDEALLHLAATHADVVLVRADLPADGALTFVETVRDEWPSMRCVLCATEDDSAAATRAVAVGAFGYVSTAGTLEALSEAVRTAADGEVYMSHRMSRKVLASILFSEAAPSAPAENALSAALNLDRLSDRELQVFHLLAEGYTPAQIADRLGIQSRTIRLHLRHIQRKLDVDSYADVLKLSTEWQGRAQWVARCAE